MNQLFYEYLKKYTYHPFELIIIDNGSTDDSQKYFLNQGVTVIQNDGNYMYPTCQNKGILSAKYNYLFFLNNDVLVFKHWDKYALEIMEINNFDIASCCNTDRMENNDKTNKTRKRWLSFSNVMLFLIGTSRFSLILMQLLFYGNLQRWIKRRHDKFGSSVKEGFSGCNILMKRAVLDKIGLWDERIQGADFDIFLRVKKRNMGVGDFKPILSCLVYTCTITCA